MRKCLIQLALKQCQRHRRPCKTLVLIQSDTPFLHVNLFSLTYIQTSANSKHSPWVKKAEIALQKYLLLFATNVAGTDRPYDSGLDQSWNERKREKSFHNKA